MTVSSGLRSLVDQQTEAALWTELKQDGSRQARERLFLLHATLARRLAARKMRLSGGTGVEFGDLYQLACTGLLEAIDRYDPTQGVSFRTFAPRRITGSILDGLEKLTEVSQQIAFRSRVRRARLASLTDAADEKAPDRLAELAELAVGLALSFILEDTGMLSIGDSGSSASNPYHQAAWTDVVNRVQTEVAELGGREERVIRLHYASELSFDQIADVLDCSKSRVAQLHRNGIATLRKRLVRQGVLSGLRGGFD